MLSLLAGNCKTTRSHTRPWNAKDSGRENRITPASGVGIEPEMWKYRSKPSVLLWCAPFDHSKTYAAASIQIPISPGNLRLAGRAAVRARGGRNCRLIEVKLDAHDEICQDFVERRIKTPQVTRPSYSQSKCHRK
jgi:hypothetical protein